MDLSSSLKTGDAILFSGNTPTGFILRTAVSSEWNHSGIAVRLLPDVSHSDRKVISLTEEGDLYILETNTGDRKDDVYGNNIIGAGFSHAEYAFNKYNRIAVRRLHDVFRTQTLADLTLEFYEKYRGRKFPTGAIPFISIFIGIELTDKNPNEMFCSELMAHYYTYTIGPQYKTATGIEFDGKLSTLFGHNSPYLENMFTPGHYAHMNTPNASIFKSGDEIIYICYADILYIILQPFILIIFVMIIIWMLLP